MNLPMSVEAVVIYLGLVLAGCAVVSIADSFAADEVRAARRASRPACLCSL
jgi:acyl-coenzyme A synthetase/AMP-(fatty) acid ligase